MSLYAVANKLSYKAEQLPTSPSYGRGVSSWLFDYFSGEETPSGIRVTPEDAISIDTLFNAITILQESVAQLPLHLIREESVTIQGRERNKRTKATNDPRFKLMHGEALPGLMTSYNFKKVMEGQVCQYDRAYALIERDSFNDPIGLFPWPAKFVQMRLVRFRNGQIRPFYEFEDPFFGGPSQIVSGDNVLHVIGYSANGFEGKSRIQLMANSLGNVIAADDFAGKYFGKGVNVSGYIKHPRRLRDQAAVNRLKESFAQAHGGPNNQFGVGVLEDGADWVKNEVNPHDAQMIESRKFNALTIAKMLNVPVTMLKHLERGTYSNVEQLDLQFAKYTLAPRLVNWEQELDRKLLTTQEKNDGSLRFKFNMKGLLRGDTATQANWYQTMQSTGAYSPNDILEKEDENPFEGGEVHVINPGAQSVEQLANNTNDE